MAGRINKSHPSYITSKASAEKAIKEVSKNLQLAIDNMKVASEEVLYEIGLNVLNTSNRYAPLDNGELRDSSYIIEEKTKDSYTVEIGYTSDHAVYQHELYGTSYKDPTTPGTTPKFLQNALNEVEADIERIVADAERNILK